MQRRKCRHRNITWPMRLEGKRLLTVSCLDDCKQRLAYDWSSMQVVDDPWEARRLARLERRQQNAAQAA